MRNCYDVIIIGGGVVGSSVARELSRYHIKVCVLEKEADVCCGNSGRNTGILHAGFLHETGMLKASLAVEGNRAFTRQAEELDVPFKRTGKLVVGFTEGQRETIEGLKKRGDASGVPGLRIIGRDDIKQIEPNVAGEFAMYSPSSGILCPYRYTIALAENAKLNGVDYYFEHGVTAVKREADDTYTVDTPKGGFHAKWVVNSAGLDAFRMAAMLGSVSYGYRMDRGEYLLLDKKAGEYLRIPVYPAPDKSGLCDIHVSPTIDGNVLIGPTNGKAVDSADFDTTRDGLAELAQRGMFLFAKMKPNWVIRSYCGVFPRLLDPGTGLEMDFVIEHKEERPTVINLLGMDSPALTAAYPIGRRVAEIIAKREGLATNERFDPRCKGIKRFAEQDYGEQRRMIEQNPDYGEIICRCECVTKAEILEAVHNVLGVSNVNGIKYRTRAMMGRCQGGYCETRITSILQEELGKKKTEITLSNSESYMFTGEVRGSCK